METMGRKFTAAREKKKLTLSRAAALTRIKVQHLELMEQDDFSTMPAPTYAKGFIRIYAELLGMDSEPLIREYIEKHLEANIGSVAIPARGKKVRTERKSEKTFDPESLEIVKQLKLIFSELGGRMKSVTPKLPQIVVTVVTVLVLVGMVRCAVRLSDGENEPLPQKNLLDERAIMKQPPVRYFELPTKEHDAL